MLMLLLPMLLTQFSTLQSSCYGCSSQIHTHTATQDAHTKLMLMLLVMLLLLLLVLLAEFAVALATNPEAVELHHFEAL